MSNTLSPLDSASPSCNPVKLEIDTTLLAALMEKGLLHASDFRCLDNGSKKIVWQMLLSLTRTRIDRHAGTNCGQKTRFTAAGTIIVHGTSDNAPE